MGDRLIIVDSNYLCHYCAFSSRGLSFDGRPTGVIFSFLKQVLGVAKRFGTRRFVFAWDSRQSMRRIAYQRYKQNRVEREKTPAERRMEKEERAQFKELRTRVLPRLGFRNQLLQTGYEADDVIASVAVAERFLNDVEVVIVGADNDLYQLLDGKTCMYKPRDKATYGATDFRDEWGIDPMMWNSVKAIAGCSGDNVEGVHGVGEKTAVKYLLGALRGDSKTAVAIRDSREVIDRNTALVSLPLAGTKKFELAEDGPFLLSDFLAVVDAYGLESFREAGALAQWRDAFGMR